jgi:DNA-binding transcriptional ArsR family regulator
MITIPLSTEDLTKVRLAPSPLWETVTSFGVLLHRGRHTVHAPWANRGRRVLPGTDLSALVATLGTVRASVLKSLSPMPSTTTELANQLRLSPATISAHLSRLKAAELVEPHRSGKRVYYRLSGPGESLLGIFGETS